MHDHHVKYPHATFCDAVPPAWHFSFSFSSSTRVRSLGIQRSGNSPTFDILSESEKTFMQLRLKKPNPFQQPCYHSTTRMSTLRNQLRVTQLLIFGAKRRWKPFVSRFAAAADQKARSASSRAFWGENRKVGSYKKFRGYSNVWVVLSTGQITIQWISIMTRNNCVIQWIEILG